MIELTEHVWKHRFARRLLVFFLTGGVAEQDAQADADAHAQDEYIARGSGTPEQQADAVIAAIQAEQMMEVCAH